MNNDRHSVPEHNRQTDQELVVQLNMYVDQLHALTNEEPSRSSVAPMDESATEYVEPLRLLDAFRRTLNTVAYQADTQVDEQPEKFRPVLKQFGKYEMEHELGRGGMGVVYRARQTDLNRIVAIKMIRANHLASAEEVRRFRQEAQAAGRLRHPNIISIHEVGDIHGQHYFSMDYISGRSLAERQTLVYETDAAAELVVTLARAIQYLHDNDIVHRDIKPSNIIIDDQNRPYITDFGLAKVFNAESSNQTQSGTIMGTPAYMAPEQAAGLTDNVCVQSDVYSLGTILFELLTGRPPLRADTPLDTLVQVLEIEAPLPSQLNKSLPHELDLICQRALEKNPEKRYASAAELANDLERFLKRETIAAKPRGFWNQLERWSRREPALSSRWAAILVAAIIVQSAFQLTEVQLKTHLLYMGLFAVWALLTYVFQLWEGRTDGANAARIAWSVTDVVMLTTMLVLAWYPVGPLVIGYPLLIVASGLFFRVNIVLLTTCMSLIGYTAVLLLRTENTDPSYYSIIFACVLVLIGFVVAYQVQRIRVLSRFYENRRY